jgi:hypothetical protein
MEIIPCDTKDDGGGHPVFARREAMKQSLRPSDNSEICLQIFEFCLLNSKFGSPEIKNLWEIQIIYLVMARNLTLFRATSSLRLRRKRLSG